MTLRITFIFLFCFIFHQKETPYLEQTYLFKKHSKIENTSFGYLLQVVF